MSYYEWIGFLMGVASFIIGVVGFAVAWSEKKSRKNLENYFRTQNWFLYDKASNVNGIVQEALRRYKALGKEALDPEILGFLSQADAFGQDVLKDTLRLIQFSEPPLDGDTVNRWVREGRVPIGHATIFNKLTPANKPLQINPPEPTKSLPT